MLQRLQAENERLRRDNERFVRLIDSGEWGRGRVAELVSAGGYHTVAVLGGSWPAGTGIWVRREKGRGLMHMAVQFRVSIADMMYLQVCKSKLLFYRC
jgi:hypothetical protein